MITYAVNFVATEVLTFFYGCQVQFRIFNEFSWTKVCEQDTTTIIL
jgi:hypothetical protein